MNYSKAVLLTTLVFPLCGYGQSVMPNFEAEVGVGASYPTNAENGLSTKLGLSYKLNPHLGLYASYDAFDVSNDALSLATLGIKMKSELNSDLHLLGKVGVSNLLNQDTDSRLSNTIGLGAEYRLTTGLSALAGVDYYYHVPVARNEKLNISQVYVGIAYRFGQVNSEVVTQVEPLEPREPNVQPVELKAPEVTSAKKLFGFDSVAISSTIALEKMVRSLLANPSLKVEVKGYTDSLGSPSYNNRLSKQRAQAVANYLIDSGINEARITVFGLGESDPVASNGTEIGRAQNRRVDVLIK
ncbi:OmpA family protein [Vibrio campbellii]|uniref:OmpA family protein n=1 Tax=Vibrio campbellii TaxID=680 RepID=A0AAQ2XW16_9VIBR|nr:OmpA family protein [Vibrio campbellii]WDG07088.1 OmpA family protein [Vibrio campbellii]